MAEKEASLLKLLTHSRSHAIPTRGVDRPRVLLPLAGPTDPRAIDVAVQAAKADDAMLVASYLAIVPLHLHADAPRDPSWSAGPLFEAVEWAALPNGVPVTTRIAPGRTLRHALARLWAAEPFDRVVAPVATDGGDGFSGSDVAWLVDRAPGAVLVVKPAPGPVRAVRAELG